MFLWSPWPWPEVEEDVMSAAEPLECFMLLPLTVPPPPLVLRSGDWLRLPVGGVEGAELLLLRVEAAISRRPLPFRPRPSRRPVAGAPPCRYRCRPHHPPPPLLLLLLRVGVVVAHGHRRPPHPQPQRCCR